MNLLATKYLTSSHQPLPQAKQREYDWIQFGVKFNLVQPWDPDKGGKQWAVLLNNQAFSFTSMTKVGIKKGTSLKYTANFKKSRSQNGTADKKEITSLRYYWSHEYYAP